jgi:hypothetical protein
MWVSPSVVAFDNLSDVLLTLEDYANIHNEAIGRYRERLGLLLRQREGGNTQGSSDFTLSSDQLLGAELAAQGKNKKDPKKKEKDLDDQQGWLVFEASDYALKVASNQGNAAQTASLEISVLFKMVETLNAKVMNLKTAAKMISELPSHGIRADQKFLVIFRDGIPRQVVPTNESGSNQPKFRFQEVFELEPLESL